MTDYALEQIDDIWTIVKNGEDIGRVISKRDGEAILSELKGYGNGVLRDRVLSAVNDAIEGEFEETA